MGLFGWGERDTSTPQEREGWRERAEEQIHEQEREKRGITREPPKPGHRKAVRPRDQR